MIGPILLLARVIALGFERPSFKALARERDSVAATALNYLLALVLMLVVLAGLFASGQPIWTGVAGWWPFALASGVVAFAGYNLNMYALGRGDIGLLSPVYSLGLVALYFLEIIFGSARFDWFALLAILLVASGVALLDLKPGSHWHELLSPLRMLKAPGAWPMLLSALLLGVVRVIDKQGSAMAPQIPYAFAATVPVVILSLALLAIRGKGLAPLWLLRERPLAAWGAALAHTSGYLILLGAYRYFNASVVEPVAQLSLLVNLYIAVLWFGEPARGRLVPTLLVAAGTALLLLTTVNGAH